MAKANVPHAAAFWLGSRVGQLGSILRLVMTALSEGGTMATSCEAFSRLSKMGASSSSRARLTVVRADRDGATVCSAFRRSTRFLDSAISSSAAGTGRTSSSDSFSSVVFATVGAADTRDALPDLRVEPVEGDGEGAFLTVRDGVLRLAGAGLFPLALLGVLTVEFGVA